VRAPTVTDATRSRGMIAKRQIAEQADRLNANSYTSENLTIDHFDDENADQVGPLIRGCAPPIAYLKRTSIARSTTAKPSPCRERPDTGRSDEN